MRRFSKWTAVIVCLIVALFGAPLSVQCAAESENIVLHRPYQMAPAPQWDYSTDPGDVTQLTDGETNYLAGYIWRDNATVGWNVGIDVPVVIWFDLEGLARLDKVVLNTVGGGGAGVFFVGWTVYVSDDDKTYTLAGELPAPPLPEEENRRTEGRQAEVSLGGVCGRYVAIVALPPPPSNFTFLDEVEIIGSMPAPASAFPPTGPSVMASGCAGLQKLLAEQREVGRLMDSLTAPLMNQMRQWPVAERNAQLEEMTRLREQAMAQPSSYERVRTQLIESHRRQARRVYGKEFLCWEVVPDAPIGFLSLPDQVNGPQVPDLEIHTAVNALEAAALGLANLTEQPVPLSASISAPPAAGAPVVTVRVARYSPRTTNDLYVADALLLADSPQLIPSGETKLIWLEAESSQARSGTYRYTVHLEVGSQSLNVPLQVKVYPVQLAKATPLTTGNWAYLNTGEFELGPELRDAMRAHRITAAAMTLGCLPMPKLTDDGTLAQPMELDTAALDKALDYHGDFDQYSFFIGDPMRGYFGKAQWMSDEYKHTVQEWIKQLVACFEQRGLGYGRWYLQIFDETTDKKVGEISQVIKEADPQVRTMITIGWHSASRKTLTGSGILPWVNIIVCHATGLTRHNAPDGFELYRQPGHELWFYSAYAAGYGHGRERDPLTFYRLLHWLAFYHGATGVHFWNYYHNPNPWEDGNLFWGQIYAITKSWPAPPDVKTAEKVIPTRRFQYRRMGIEDYMLLKMAQDAIGELRDAGKAQQAAGYERQLDSLVAAVLDHPQDRQGFRARRRQLLVMLTELDALR